MKIKRQTCQDINTNLLVLTPSFENGEQVWIVSKSPALAKLYSKKNLENLSPKGSDHPSLTFKFRARDFIDPRDVLVAKDNKQHRRPFLVARTLDQKLTLLRSSCTMPGKKLPTGIGSLP